MDLSLQDVATLLGCSPRTLRARLARGDVTGRKVGSRWLIDRDALPLTADQRRALRERVDGVRATVERAIRKRSQVHSVEDLNPFSHGRALLHTLPADEPAAVDLRAGLTLLAVAHHEFDRQRQITALHEARAAVARAAGALLLGATPDQLAWGRRLEDEVLPPIGGLVRWAEGLGG